MIRQLAILTMTMLGLMVTPIVVYAQSYVELQDAKKKTGVDEKAGERIALNARFMDVKGNWSSLKEFFFDDRPVFLSMNYADCPQLCRLPPL